MTTRRDRPHGALNRPALIGGIGLILVGVVSAVLTVASDLKPSNWLAAMWMLGFAGIGAIAWALPERVDFLGRSRKMMAGAFFLVGVVFATLAAFGVDLNSR